MTRLQLGALHPLCLREPPPVKSAVVGMLVYPHAHALVTA